VILPDINLFIYTFRKDVCAIPRIEMARAGRAGALTQKPLYHRRTSGTAGIGPACQIAPRSTARR